jgi:hypothetical protein
MGIFTCIIHATNSVAEGKLQEKHKKEEVRAIPVTGHGGP